MNNPNALVVSETERATAASQSRFRVQAPNSRRRTVGLVALGRQSGQLVEDLLHHDAERARIYLALAGEEGAPRLSSFEGSAITAEQIVDEVDLVILVTTPEEDNHDVAKAVVAACLPTRKSLISVVVSERDFGETEMRRSLATLRPDMQMLVVARDASYLDTLLTAFGR